MAAGVWVDRESWLKSIQEDIESYCGRDSRPIDAFNKTVRKKLEGSAEEKDSSLCWEPMLQQLKEYDMKMEEALSEAVSQQAVFLAHKSSCEALSPEEEYREFRSQCISLKEGRGIIPTIDQKHLRIFPKNQCPETTGMPFVGWRYIWKSDSLMPTHFSVDDFIDSSGMFSCASFAHLELAMTMTAGGSSDAHGEAVLKGNYSGRYVDYLRRNWHRQSEKGSAAWDDAFAHVSSKVSDCSYDSLDEFESAVEAAKAAAVEAFGLGESDFWEHARRRVDDDVAKARSKVVLGLAKKEVDLAKAEVKSSAQAAKDAGRRELKMVLDKTKKMEEQIAALVAAAAAAAAASGEGTKVGGGGGAGKAGGAGASGGGGSTSKEEAGEEGEEACALRSRVDALEEIMGKVEGAEGRAGDKASALEKRLTLLEAKCKEGWAASDDCLDQIVSLREQISCVGDRAEEVARMGQQLKMMLEETESRLGIACEERESVIAGRCKDMFELLSRNGDHNLARSELHIRSELQKQVSSLQSRDRELASTISSGLADASSGIDDVGSKLIKANEEIESVWIKVEQSRDQISALWKMLEALPNADNLKAALHEASSYIPGQHELSSVFTSVKRRVSAGIGTVKSAAQQQQQQQHQQHSGTPPQGSAGRGRSGHPATPLPPTPLSDSDSDG